MIYITAAEVQPVRIPRTAAVASLEEPALLLNSTVDKHSYQVPVLSIEEDGDYFAISADFTSLNAPGDYEYLLTLRGDSAASGVAMLGSLPDPAPVQTEIDIEFKQYEQD